MSLVDQGSIVKDLKQWYGSLYGLYTSKKWQIEISFRKIQHTIMTLLSYSRPSTGHKLDHIKTPA